jgi:phosphatidylinositol transfer protein SFH5
MEFGVQKLNLASVTEPIPEDGQDPYQMIQVHDYLSVSFLRMDPHVKAASSETIKIFSTAYPELLAHKYFVNVPTIMGWMYAAMKLFLAPATLKKFHPMSSGTTLATELPGITSTLPKEYGGKGAGLKEQGLIIKLEGAKEEIPQDAGEAPVAAVTESKAEEAKAVEQPAEKPVETTKTEELKPAAVETNPDAPVAAAVTEAEAKPLAATEEKPAEVKAA